MPYATPEECTAYTQSSLRSATWDQATADLRLKALNDATRRIDRLNFSGLRTVDKGKTGPLTPGTPEFPRNGSLTVPQDIKDACCEIAMALLDGVDPEQELRNVSALSHGIGSARVVYDVADARMAFRHGIPSITAWHLLLPYLADPSEFTIARTS